MNRSPATRDELLTAYQQTGLERDGIRFEAALEVPCLRAVLQLGAEIRRRRRERLGQCHAGVGIERSHPDQPRSRNRHP